MSYSTARDRDNFGYVTKLATIKEEEWNKARTYPLGTFLPTRILFRCDCGKEFELSESEFNQVYIKKYMSCKDFNKKLDECDYYGRRALPQLKPREKPSEPKIPITISVPVTDYALVRQKMDKEKYGGSQPKYMAEMISEAVRPMREKLTAPDEGEYEYED